MKKASPLHEALGFRNHPFAQTNADEEPDLDKYFIRPNFFDAVIGDPERPSASVIFGPRGGGKTAQRKMVQNISEKGEFLAVTYDRLDSQLAKKPLETARDQHLRAIATRVFAAYLSLLAGDKERIAALNDQHRRSIASLAHIYLKDMDGDAFTDILREVKPLTGKIREFWSENVGIMQPVITFVTKWLTLPAIKVPRGSKMAPVQGSPKAHLETLTTLVKAAGKQSIYVLIDKVDETPTTNNNAEASYKLVRPLLTDLELLGLNGFAFKFFLWDKVEEHYRNGDARPDRVPIYNIRWERRSLQVLLGRRLEAFSEGHIKSFVELAPEVAKSDASICLFANLSPRNTVRIGERIFAHQAELSKATKVIATRAFQQGLSEFCEQYTKDTYNPQMIKDLQRVGRELFTVSYLAANVFKVKDNAARNKITGWTNAGLVSHIGSVRSAKKPHNLYCVVDPCVVRLIRKSDNLEEFLSRSWHECANCQRDNLFDPSIYNDDFEPICANCGKPLTKELAAPGRGHPRLS